MKVTVRRRTDCDSWIVDIRWKGQRARRTFGDEQLANAVADEVRRLLMRAELDGRGSTLAALLQEPAPTAPPVDTVGTYAAEWIRYNSRKNGWKRSTLQNYRSIVDTHILPAWQEAPLADVTRVDVKQWLLGIAKQRKPKTVRNIYRAMSSLLSAACDDGLIPINPILRMGRVLPRVKQSRIRPRAWTPEQLAAILDAAREHTPEHYPLFLQLAKTGQRIAEAIATQWVDVDFVHGGLRTDRTWVRGDLDETKGRQYRTVGLTIQIATSHPPLAKVLRRLKTERKRQMLERGWKSLSPWVHPNADGTRPVDPDDLRDRFWSVVLEHARVDGQPVPDHGFHGFRHTMATTLLLEGVPMFRVSRLLGHSSVATTADIYGGILPEFGHVQRPAESESDA